MLLLCIGSTTRLARFLQGHDKIYEVELETGIVLREAPTELATPLHGMTSDGKFLAAANKQLSSPRHLNVLYPLAAVLSGHRAPATATLLDRR